MTRQISVGGVKIGGGAPVSIQSMLNTKTTDVEGSLQQIHALRDAGCQIVRLAVPNAEAARGFALICKESPLPLVADIHFDYKLAIAAAEGGAAKIRINPGNIGGEDRVKAVVDVCKERASMAVVWRRNCCRNTAIPRQRHWWKALSATYVCWRNLVFTTLAFL